MKKYIVNVTTLEELKKAYKKLVLKHHPDVGGDEEVMKAIINEYETLFEKLKNVHKNKDGDYYEDSTEETSGEFVDIINQLLALRMVGVLIEIIGSFIWLTGNTMPYKEELGKKGIGFRWSQRKQAWYKSPEGYRRYGKLKYSLDNIRDMYGSQKVEDGQTQKLIGQ